MPTAHIRIGVLLNPSSRLSNNTRDIVMSAGSIFRVNNIVQRP